MAIFTKKADKKEAPKKAAGNPKELTGIVVSTKMKDTVVVKVDRFEKAPKYERFIKISKKYKAHDAGNTKKEGEKVTIVECAPISKDKHFKVL
jgi:small subunit ribosomal protein S17